MKKRTSMNYSMTKKQRKNLSESDKKTQPEISEEEKAVLEEQKTAKRAKRKSIMSIAIIAVSVFLSIALIVSAVTIYFVRRDNFIPDGNPIAKIYLDNGMELEYELHMDWAPIAVTNFIFLSKIGFYDNTVINDIQNNWIRFSGYEKGYTGYNDGVDSAHRTQNIEFAKASDKYFKKYNFKYFTDKIQEDGYEIIDNEGQIFNYRLEADKNEKAQIKDDIEIGDLLFYNSSSTTIQMAGAKDAQLDVFSGSKTKKSLTSSTRFGTANNDETRENLKQLAALDTVAPDSSSYWNRPEQEIVITKIEILNIGRRQWRERLNKIGIDVYLESVLNPDKDSFSSGVAGHRRTTFVDGDLH